MVTDADQKGATWDPVEIPTGSNISGTLEQTDGRTVRYEGEGRGVWQAQGTPEAMSWAVCYCTQSVAPPFT